MESFLFVGLTVAGTWVIHVILHRVLILYSKPTPAINAIYPVGFMVLIFLWKQGRISLPLSSFVLYMLITIFLSYFYMTLFLGGQTPASMILESFIRKNQQTYSELLGLFTMDGLIWRRIDDLISAGLVREQHKKYVLTQKGRSVAALIQWYEKVFHRTLRG